MNSSLISLPVRLVVLLRRLVNVISALSLTNQYLLSSLHSPPSDPSPPPSSTLISAYFPDLASLGWRVYSSPTETISSTEHGTRSETNPLDTTPSLYPTRPPDNQCSPGPPPPQLPRENTERHATIHRLMNNPTLFDPARAPRYPIVLCHGMHSFYSHTHCLTPSQDYTGST